jgi:putative oxidoreductase
MKIAMISVRTLVGLLFIAASVVVLFGIVTPPPIPDGPLKTFNEGMAASGYLLTLVKVTELLGGILLVSGRFVPLALLILSPIVINILMVHIFLDRTGLPVAIFLTGAFIFLGYYYRAAFAPLLTPKYE